VDFSVAGGLLGPKGMERADGTSEVVPTHRHCGENCNIRTAVELLILAAAMAGYTVEIIPSLLCRLA
jgi:hypothetical protein